MPPCPVCRVSCFGFVVVAERKSIKSQILDTSFGKSWDSEQLTADDKRSCPICLDDFDTITDSALVATVRENNSFCHLFCRNCLVKEDKVGRILRELDLKAPPPFTGVGFDSIKLLSSQVPSIQPSVTGGEFLDIDASLFQGYMAKMLPVVRQQRDQCWKGTGSREFNLMKKSLDLAQATQKTTLQELSRARADADSVRDSVHDLRKAHSTLRAAERYWKTTLDERNASILELERKVDFWKTLATKPMATNDNDTSDQKRSSVTNKKFEVQMFPVRATRENFFFFRMNK